MTGPVPGTDERTTLTVILDRHRLVVLRKVAGLTDDQARGTALPSGTTLWGLLSHLMYMERWWFATVIAGLDVEIPPDQADEWRPPEGTTLADLVAAYEAECARSREVLAAADLDMVVNPEGFGERTVRWVLVHVVAETARHAGHADALRELIDGATGV